MFSIRVMLYIFEQGTIKYSKEITYFLTMLYGSLKDCYLNIFTVNIHFKIIKYATYLYIYNLSSFNLRL